MCILLAAALSAQLLCMCAAAVVWNACSRHQALSWSCAVVPKHGDTQQPVLVPCANGQSCCCGVCR